MDDRVTQDDKTTISTRVPLYFGLVRADAVCDRHGDMVFQGPPVVERNGQVYAAREGVSLFSCPECCLDLFTNAGEPTVDPDRVVELLWKQYLDDGWNRSIQELFVNLGAGRLESRGGLSVVLSNNGNFDETDTPEYLHGRVARIV